ncbi:hypothetical protein [Bizionia myxarmorum]|uniref:hypothetical protein n=1 Tax=Bizionia myxarmorum TaxID=291186 RepID=UPI001FE26BFA|nr:hypothetical protein [Bizionia myxarmorum]
MIKAIIITTFILFANVLLGQNDNAIFQFDKNLNQFHNVRDLCVSESGKEAFFTLQSPNGEISQIATMKKEDNVWLEPELLPFCGAYMYLEPFLSSNGNRLFFVSDRPLYIKQTEKKDFDIWYVDRNSRDQK